jgi:hypothetical protein
MNRNVLLLVVGKGFLKEAPSLLYTHEPLEAKRFQYNVNVPWHANKELNEAKSLIEASDDKFEECVLSYEIYRR